ncbi:hypothetical protein [uncultured Desulfuromonas sp.]|uniref:hypothetical protein n=1 Tax=uncultured Desulfuromonas sp. TaxID=181013 RepID=UPI00261EA02F|nr:hypothetical protein [uncultured Desulfuromonas sp.]
MKLNKEFISQQSEMLKQPELLYEGDDIEALKSKARWLAIQDGCDEIVWTFGEEGQSIMTELKVNDKYKLVIRK